jgi:hypothetical protein
MQYSDKATGVLWLEGSKTDTNVDLGAAKG